MVEQTQVPHLHRHQIIARLIVPHAGPCRRFILLQLIDRVRRGFGFEEEVLLFRFHIDVETREARTRIELPVLATPHDERFPRKDTSSRLFLHPLQVSER